MLETLYVTKQEKIEKNIEFSEIEIDWHQNMKEINYEKLRLI